MPGHVHPFDLQMSRNGARLTAMRKLFERKRAKARKEPLWHGAVIVGLLIGTMASMSANNLVLKRVLEARIHLQMPQRPGVVEVGEIRRPGFDL